jgi:hypothetical protein
MAFLVPLPPKAPAAILDYQMDWSAWLAAGEAIQGTPVVTPDPGITLNPSGQTTTVSNGVVTFWLGGGTAGTSYNVTVTVSTQSRTDSRTIAVQVGTRSILSASA